MHQYDFDGSAFIINGKAPAKSEGSVNTSTSKGARNFNNSDFIHILYWWIYRKQVIG